jgi:uncharacterized iron-regulated membrane protein
MSSPIRNLARKLHLWLGLTAGLVVTVVCATGAILAFETEIVRGRHPEYYRVATEGSKVPLQQALDSLARVLPDAKLSGVVIQGDPLATWEFNYGSAGRAYVDPYTGRVIATGVKRPAFFSTTQELHRWLLAPDVGRPIVGAATICFVFILILGLVLWWPKTKGAFKARINPFAVFSKHGGGRRKLHDLHVSLGIWLLVPLLVMALTGLPEGYRWATRFLYVVTNSPEAPSAPTSTSDTTLATLDPETALRLGGDALGWAKQWTLRFPMRPTGAITVTSIPENAWHDRAVDQVYLDRVTGAVLRLDRWNDLVPGLRARRSIYPWHFGTIWGFPSKLVAFLACLLGASFPLTGFLMYRAGLRRPAPES